MQACNQPFQTMKTFAKPLLILCVFLMTAGCKKTDPRDDVYVLITYRAQPNKSVDAVNALRRLIEDVKKEDHFVSIDLHVDQANNANIMLFERWDDEGYYRNQHMETQHMKDFIVSAQQFLVGPPQISYWKLHERFE